MNLDAMMSQRTCEAIDHRTKESSERVAPSSTARRRVSSKTSHSRVIGADGWVYRRGLTNGARTTFVRIVEHRWMLCSP